MAEEEWYRMRKRPEKKEKYLLSIKIPKWQDDALLKLRIIKGLQKSDVVAVALDLVLDLPADEIARLIDEKRREKASPGTETGSGQN